MFRIKSGFELDILIVKECPMYLKIDLKGNVLSQDEASVLMILKLHMDLNFQILCA